MKIGIIGAGASGLIAAITAAKQGAEVTLIERKDRICKKILATGNGKCNFTNHSMNISDFNSQSKNIFIDYISHFDNNAVISMFEDMGMDAVLALSDTQIIRSYFGRISIILDIVIRIDSNVLTSPWMYLTDFVCLENPRGCAYQIP